MPIEVGAPYMERHRTPVLTGIKGRWLLACPGRPLCAGLAPFRTGAMNRAPTKKTRKNQVRVRFNSSMNFTASRRT
jgi:hypothetical protein